MHTLQQLSPPIPLDTPKGKALAHIIIDYGPEFDLRLLEEEDKHG